MPAKKRVRFAVHLNYPYSTKEKENADLDERKKYRQAVEKYINDEMGNLDGFDLLNETNRYEIVFPRRMGSTLTNSELFLPVRFGRLDHLSVCAGWGLDALNLNPWARISRISRLA